MLNISARPSASPPAVHQLKISRLLAAVVLGLLAQAARNSASPPPRTTAPAVAPAVLKNCRRVQFVFTIQIPSTASCALPLRFSTHCLLPADRGARVRRQ